MTTRQHLAARRRLLAANATLQRLRLAHDAHVLRASCRPPRWIGVALAGAALGAAWWARRSQPPAREPVVQTAASLPWSAWALRGLTLWRAVHALRRVWLARESHESRP